MNEGTDGPAPVLLLFPSGPIVEGRIPGDSDLPAFIRDAIAESARLKWFFVTEFCVFFVLGLNNLYLILVPWVGIIGWFAVNSLQPLTLAIVAALHFLLSFTGSLCLGMQLRSNTPCGVCGEFFDVSSSSRKLEKIVVILFLVMGMSAISTISWKFRAFIINNLAQEDRSRLIALS